MGADATASSCLGWLGLLSASLVAGLCIWLVLGAAPGLAQSPPRVQILTGSLDPGERTITISPT